MLLMFDIFPWRLTWNNVARVLKCSTYQPSLLLTSHQDQCEQIVTIACSILLSIATAPLPLKIKQQNTLLVQFYWLRYSKLTKQAKRHEVEDSIRETMHTFYYYNYEDTMLDPNSRPVHCIQAIPPHCYPTPHLHIHLNPHPDIQTTPHAIHIPTSTPTATLFTINIPTSTPTLIFIPHHTPSTYHIPSIYPPQPTLGSSYHTARHLHTHCYPTRHLHTHLSPHPETDGSVELKIIANKFAIDINNIWFKNSIHGYNKFYNFLSQYDNYVNQYVKNYEFNIWTEFVTICFVKWNLIFVLHMVFYKRSL